MTAARGVVADVQINQQLTYEAVVAAEDTEFEEEAGSTQKREEAELAPVQQ
ncbi:hypothetical protein [Caldimonas brevitalea]|uniref:hypothetical protein n=1 Tax=Caldimonas brevitalea TaxID=413882 RepID=UPI0012F90851|nr:hypothetical protein [Caldimonas brevitalea]